MWQLVLRQFHGTIKLCLVVLISFAISVPAYAEYYMVPYYTDACCCCPVAKKKRVKHVKKKRVRCPTYVETYTTAPTMEMAEYAWIPDPWDP